MSPADISAKGDYAVRALLALADLGPEPVHSEDLARDQDLPRKYLESIMADLRRADLVRSARGASGGYRLSREPGRITVGQVLRAVDGPLAGVRGLSPDLSAYQGAAAHLPDVWGAMRAAMADVLDATTLEHVRTGAFPAPVRELAERAGVSAGGGPA